MWAWTADHWFQIAVVVGLAWISLCAWAVAENSRFRTDVRPLLETLDRIEGELTTIARKLDGVSAPNHHVREIAKHVSSIAYDFKHGRAGAV